MGRQQRIVISSNQSVPAQPSSTSTYWLKFTTRKKETSAYPVFFFPCPPPQKKELLSITAILKRKILSSPPLSFSFAPSRLLFGLCLSRFESETTTIADNDTKSACKRVSHCEDKSKLNSKPIQQQRSPASEDASSPALPNNVAHCIAFSSAWRLGSGHRIRPAQLLQRQPAARLEFDLSDGRQCSQRGEHLLHVLIYPAICAQAGSCLPTIATTARAASNRKAGRAASGFFLGVVMQVVSAGQGRRGLSSPPPTTTVATCSSISYCYHGLIALQSSVPSLSLLELTSQPHSARGDTQQPKFG